MAVNLNDALAHHADRDPERVAVRCGDVALTWAQLHEEVARTAGALAALGVRRGDVVGVLLHNSYRFIELMYACAHAGAVFMPLNWRLAGPELHYIVNHAQARLLVSENELAGSVAAAGDLCCGTPVAIDAHAGWRTLDDARAGAGPLTAGTRIEDGDLARLMYTSGTTSRPKGVMITFANLEAKNLAHLVEFGITREHRALVCGPLYHVGALDMVTTTVLQAGGTVHILRRFDAGQTLEAIETHALTHVWMPPVILNIVLAHPSLGAHDLGSMQVITGGGERTPLPVVERTRAAFPNAWFADAYGMTETVSGDTFLARDAGVAKTGSVGKPVFNCELRVVDPAGAEVPAGRPGEIVMRGPKVCAGYFRDADATSAALRDGWLHTGDVGVLDEDGFLYIVDRLKDMIISGGENVASSEVERVLYEHPGTFEAAVVGRSDPKWGEVPVAYVVCRGKAPPETELIAFCRSRLSGYKVPKVVRFTDELPRTPSGKVLKRVLREREDALQRVRPGG